MLNIDKTFQNEISDLKCWDAKLLTTLRSLKRDYPRLFQLLDVEKNRALGTRLLKNDDLSMLRRLNDQAVFKLNQRYPVAIQRTTAQRNCAAIFKKYSKMTIFENIWIGQFNIDIFIPHIACHPLSATNKRRHQGLAIEIDGSIHDRQEKMTKDQRKYALLDKLDILVWSIPNAHIESTLVRYFSQKAGVFSSLQVRDRRRLLKRIYLLNIYLHLNRKEIDSISTQSAGLEVDGGVAK